MKPFVSLIIVARNEEKFIELALTSLINQDYGKKNFEIIFVNCDSSDKTEEIAKGVLEKSGCLFRLLRNPRITLATGWNLAIKNAHGEFVCRIDAHGELESSYISKGVDIFLFEKKKDLICVGGVLVNRGEGFWGEVASDLFSSKFGIGNSPFRCRASKRAFTDTAAMGLYKKSIFEELGYFDETLERNQDIAFHKNALKNNFKFITDPGMEFFYYVRSSFDSLVKKAYQDGYWVFFSKANYFRHKVPFFFFVYFICFVLNKLHGGKNRWLNLPAQLYFALSIAFSFKDGRGKNKLVLPILFFSYHLAYGIGSSIALTELFFKKK